MYCGARDTRSRCGLTDACLRGKMGGYPDDGNLCGGGRGVGSDSDDAAAHDDDDGTMDLGTDSGAVPEIAGDADGVDDVAYVQAAGRRGDPISSLAGQRSRRQEQKSEVPDQEPKAKSIPTRTIAQTAAALDKIKGTEFLCKEIFDYTFTLESRAATTHNGRGKWEGFGLLNGRVITNEKHAKETTAYLQAASLLVQCNLRPI
jgi:hypothetical protein